MKTKFNLTILFIATFLLLMNKNSFAQCSTTGADYWTTGAGAASANGLSLTTYNNKVIVINHDINFDADITFTNGCDIKVCSDILLTIDDGVTVTIDGSTVHSANSTMWYGIYFDDDSHLELAVQNGTIISDMNSGIQSYNGGWYDISGSTISDSYTGLFIDPYAGTHPGTVTSTTFQGSLSLNTGATDPESFCAVYISPSNDNVQIGDNTGGLSDQNTFDTWNIGIFSSGTNLTAENNYFTNIQAMSGFPDGFGILHKSTGNLVCDNNIFDDGGGLYEGLGIYITNCIGNSLSITDCEFDGVEDKNVYVLNNFESEIDILGNEFTDFGNSGGDICIHFEDNDGSSGTHTNITIYDNEISNADIRRAIVVEETMAPNTGYTDLSITSSDIDGVRQGIYVNGIDNATIDENIIDYSFTNASGGSLAFGIAVFNSDGVDIDFNQASGDDNSSNLGAGIFVQSCLNNTLVHNDAYQAWYGIAARFNCTGTNFLCNDLEDCANGFYLTQIPSTGGGVLKLGPVGSSGTPADNVWGYITTWSGNEINCDNGTDGADGSWYNVDAGCSGSCTGSPCAWFIPANNIGSTNPMVLIPDCSSQTCSPSYSGRGSENERDKLLLTLVSSDNYFDYTNGSANEFYNERENAYRILTSRPEWLEPMNGNDGLYSEFISSIEGSNTASIIMIQQLLKASNTDDANQLLIELEPGNTQEENWKAVLEIYAVTFAIGNTQLNNEQFETLESIAIQNCITGGNGVFTARAMTGVEHDDGINESVKLEYSGTSSSSNAVYPNPVSNGNVCFKLPVNGEKQITISIFDLAGKSCFVETRNTSEPCIEIPSWINSGMYLYTVTGNLTGRIMLKGKLLIQY